MNVAHTHHDASYWTRRHTEAVVLDIGGDLGALVLYTRPELHGHEIEVSPLGTDNAVRVHSAVLERSFNGRTVFAAVYPELAAGEYQVWCDGTPAITIMSRLRWVSRASRAIPRAKGSSNAACTASMSLCAAKPPFSSAGTILCACAMTNGTAFAGRPASETFISLTRRFFRQIPSASPES